VNTLLRHRFSASELVVREQRSGREVHVSVSLSSIQIKKPEGTESIRMFKAAKGGVIFDGTRKISSAPQMALAFLQELAVPEC
jgi:hypothetical protein